MTTKQISHLTLLSTWIQPILQRIRILDNSGWKQMSAQSPLNGRGGDEIIYGCCANPPHWSRCHPIIIIERAAWMAGPCKCKCPFHTIHLQYGFNQMSMGRDGNSYIIGLRLCQHVTGCIIPYHTILTPIKYLSIPRTNFCGLREVA